MTANEQGIYDYSGFIHCGLVEWKDIGAVSPSYADNVFEALDGKLIPCVRIILKDGKTYRRKSNIFRKIWLLFNNSEIKLNLILSSVKHSEILPLLDRMLTYYSAGCEDAETRK